MCRRVACPRCGKPTYAGCGRHIEEVLSDVPPEARCTCARGVGEPPEDLWAGLRGRPRIARWRFYVWAAGHTALAAAKALMDAAFEAVFD